MIIFEKTNNSKSATAIHLSQQLFSLNQLIAQLETEIFCKPMSEMGGSSIGQHVRHTLEIVNELISGYASGKVDYSKRKRDLKIETIPEYAMNYCLNLIENADLTNRTILFIDSDNEIIEEIPSSFYRELNFVLDHTIHHLAIIKMALRILDLSHLTDENFGMAYSTIQHHSKICVQS